MSKLLPFFLIPLISLIIIFSWFHEGKILSNTSEEELNIYHSQRTAQIYSSFWYTGGTGLKVPFLLARYPTFFVLGLFEQVGMPAFLRQALLLWVLMMAGVAGMYLLLKRSFKISQFFSIVGGFFYLLNVYSMTQVWKRFLYHGIFAWAYLPIFLFLWIEWTNNKKSIWLFIFLLSSLFFTSSFGQPANLITIWAPIGVFTIVQFWQNRRKIKNMINIASKLLLGLLLWCLINIWWLYPELSLGGAYAASSGEDFQYHFNSLQAVSKFFPPWEVALLRQSWYLSSNNDFGRLYLNPIMILINLLPLFFVVLAVVRFKTYAYRGFLLTLASVGFFICKGTNFPFGYTFFYLLFSIFPFTTALRNPYEKFGIVWLLAYTILFTIGFSRFLSSLKSKNQYLIEIVLLSLILGVLVLPFWMGGLFLSKQRLNVPQYYDDANNYLNKESQGRLFHVPFHLIQENSIYSWGYEGGDPAPVLFDRESVTKPKMPLYSKIADLLPKYLKDKQFPKILELLGVQDVILHKDIIYPKINIEETAKSIENWVDIVSKEEFGGLIIYSLNDVLVRPEIYIASFVMPVESIEEGLVKIISTQSEVTPLVFIEGGIWKNLNIQIKNVPKLTFKEISSDKYFVDIQGATEPFILIFNNTFDNSWQVKIDNQIVDKHFIVNGFANGWLIEKEGDYSIDIKLKVWPWD